MVCMAALAGSATHPNGMPMALTSGQGPQLQGHAAAFPGAQYLCSLRLKIGRSLKASQDCHSLESLQAHMSHATTLLQVNVGCS